MPILKGRRRFIMLKVVRFFEYGFVIFALLTFTAIFPVVAQEQTLASGTFVGKSGHKVSGGVSIVKTAKGVEVRLASNFKIDGAPGPYLGFGNNGKYVKTTQFSKLKKKSGAQTYIIPARIDVSKFNEFYVWCKPFNVPLGQAKLR